ncbi:MAG: hypothetical protein V7756_15575 [Halopseudomonas sp.]|uniref:hypothetical protein n=1 Tax=Halopseudomonas sp. TaxID=2901191 RepID=UPI0030027FE1
MRSSQYGKMRPLALLVPLALSGCLSGGGSSDDDAAIERSSFYPRFEPAASLADNALPMPINLAMQGTLDGTLNIPLEDVEEGKYLTLLEQVNELDGWSTIAPIQIPFSEAVDPDFLEGNVEVLRTTLVSPATAELLRQAQQLYVDEGARAAIEAINTAVASDAHAPLSGHQVPVAAFTCADPVTDQFVASVAATDEQTLLLKPLTPLAAGDDLSCMEQSGTFYQGVVAASDLDSNAFSNGYLPVLLDGFNSTEATAVGRDSHFDEVVSDASDDDSAEDSALKALYAEIGEVLSEANINADDVVLSFVFSTQSNTAVLDYLAASAEARESSFTLAVPAPGLLPNASIYNGVLQDVPYYLNNRPANLRSDGGVTAATDAAAVLSGHWVSASGQGVTRFDIAAEHGPVTDQTVDLPMVVSLPSGIEPLAGWPVIIYQHGQGSDRSAMVGLASQFAAQGWAMVAIDHPLHGIITSNPLSTYLMDAANERHFYIDMDGNGLMDASGAHSMNGTPATVRDIRRQTVSDLHNLLASLSTMSVGGQKLDTSRVGYVGISMGGVIGSMFAGTVADDQVHAFTLDVPGGGMAKLFDGSVVFAAQFRPQLAGQGLEYGTQAYETYFALDQAVQDSGDPINYAKAIDEGTAGIHMVEMVGSAEGNPPDLVLPNDLMNSAKYNAIFSTLGLSETQVAETAPLSGTTPLWQNSGLTTLTSGSASESPIRRVVRYSGGSHFSLHLPNRPDSMAPFNAEFPVADGAATMNAVQRQTVEFLTWGYAEIRQKLGHSFCKYMI